MAIIYCIKCKEYIIINPETPANDEAQFRYFHNGHPVQTTQEKVLNELKELDYTKFKGGKKDVGRGKEDLRILR